MLMVSSKEINAQTRYYAYCRATILTKTSLKEILSYYFHRTEATEKHPIKQRQWEQIQSITVAVATLPLAQKLQVARLQS